jgi:hypothetical protein
VYHPPVHAAAPKPTIGLQTTFALFLGLILTAFIGVGLYTFYPPPEVQFEDRIRELSREQQAIRNLKSPNDLTDQDRARLQALTDEINKTQDQTRQASVPWGRNTSIMLIVFATLVMAVSLTRAGQLPVLNNGLLIGGIFTMIYGVGLVLATDTSVARFIVIAMALAITLGLGYVRFVSRRATATSTAMTDSGLAALEARVAALEKRIDEAANALGRPAP